MDLIFNELSEFPLAANYTEAYKRIWLLINTFKESRKSKFKFIRHFQQFSDIKLTKDYTMQDFCNDKRNNTLNSILLGSFKQPFIDDNSEEEKKYIENNFKLITNEEKPNTAGLAAAYLYDTLGISFQSEEFWKSVEFNIEIENNGSRIDKVFCVSEPAHFGTEIIRNWLLNHEKLELKVSLYNLENKPINIRDDHGKDVLLKFSKKLVKSVYIEGVINSLPFNRKKKEFINAVKPDGKIEIVLTWTDDRYGLVVQTTGRNLRETQAIAKIIEKSYKEFT